jgi:NTPase
VARLLTLLHEAGVPVGGFSTAKLRTGGRRMGFLVEAVSGTQEVLAHADLLSPPRVGRYGVDLTCDNNGWACQDLNLGPHQQDGHDAVQTSIPAGHSGSDGAR